MLTTDYIIIGAGSAGCVLANRLTEDGNATALLLEAGGPDDDPSIHIPGAWASLLDTEIDWRYKTEPQVHLNNREISWNRGKVLGGSSSINGMAYIRGHRQDYDLWAKLGNEEWSYSEVLPYFKKSENQARGDSEFHGVGGELHVTDGILPPQANDNMERFIAAGQELGWPHNRDFNGASQAGFGRYQYTIKDGKRQSSAVAWLHPALERENLIATTHAHVLRILFEGKRAVGVEYIHNNQVKKAYASKEVILSGGAINSPQLLLCSGIGPAEQLCEFNIPVVFDLPGVGENLQDHPLLIMAFATNPPLTITEAVLRAATEAYEKSGTGLLAIPVAGGAAFVKTDPDLDIPDMQLIADLRREDSPGDVAIPLILLRPRGCGTIKLRSANPLDSPAIQPNFLEQEADRQSFIDGVRFVRRLVQSKAYDGFIVREALPGSTAQSDEEILAWIREDLQTTWHFSGTCKMGVDPMAVVNPQLQVHGVTGLRVVDASIMPEVVGGNINAPVIMIAEKAADMIKAAADSAESRDASIV